MTPGEINLGIVGASGMYGQGVIKRTFVQVANFGIKPWLGNLGMERYATDLPEITFNIVAIGTRNENSGLRMQSEYEAGTGTSPSFFWGDVPWEDMLDEHPEIDVLVVTTPDHLHYQPTVYALEKNMHVIMQKPMTLKPAEADHIIALANKKDCVVTIDTHKHFGPKHIHVKHVKNEFYHRWVRHALVSLLWGLPSNSHRDSTGENFRSNRLVRIPLDRPHSLVLWSKASIAARYWTKGPSTRHL